MNPDLHIALKLLEVHPNRYVSPNADHKVAADLLAEDTSDFVEALWPMARVDYATGAVEHLTEVEDAFLKAAADPNYDWNEVVVDEGVATEAALKPEPDPYWRGEAVSRQMIRELHERLEIPAGHDLASVIIGKLASTGMADESEPDRFANCRDRCKEVGMGGCGCA
jgi:hypothetical protein